VLGLVALGWPRRPAAEARAAVAVTMLGALLASLNLGLTWYPGYGYWARQAAMILLASAAVVTAVVLGLKSDGRGLWALLLLVPAMLLLVVAPVTDSFRPIHGMADLATVAGVSVLVPLALTVAAASIHRWLAGRAQEDR
jgi:NADPH-dependent 2,4-dienoyl-CoA reductase/sulfur reductase-like enzyme